MKMRRNLWDEQMMIVKQEMISGRSVVFRVPVASLSMKAAVSASHMQNEYFDQHNSRPSF
jgi:hypothetical protein